MKVLTGGVCDDGGVDEGICDDMYVVNMYIFFGKYNIYSNFLYTKILVKNTSQH